MDTVSSIPSRLKKPLLMSTIGLFALSALLGIFFIISAPEGDSWKILATTTLFAFFSLFSMNNVLKLDGKPLVKTLALTGIVSNIIWVSLWFMSIWSLVNDNAYEIVWKMIWIFSVLAICVTLSANYAAMKNTSALLVGFKAAALGSAWFLYVYITPAILSPDNGEYIGETWQFIAILTIIFAFGVISTPILYKVQSGKLESEGASPAPTTDSTAALRAQIEAELRPKIEAEIRQKIAEEQSRQ